MSGVLNVVIVYISAHIRSNLRDKFIKPVPQRVASQAACTVRLPASECGRAHGSPNHGGQFPASRSRPNKSNVLGCETEGAAALHFAGRRQIPVSTDS
jgi:hypothetical protein